MIEYTTHPGQDRLARLDVATGRLTPVNARWLVNPAIAW
jgi:hypothetical protein